jgi:hypothetical protein
LVPVHGGAGWMTVTSPVDNENVNLAIQAPGYATEDVSCEISDPLAGRMLGQMSDNDIMIAKLVGPGVRSLLRLASITGI